MILDTPLDCKQQGTVWAGRYSAAKLPAMVTSETVQPGPVVSAWKNAMFNLADGT